MTIWSPCKQICFVDPAAGLCVGCFRTLDELGQWTAYSDAERRQVKEQLKTRELKYRASKAVST
ncbi:DUF1289 domain-containing protein [Hyphobacterium sp.]|uniref:DUF1289 domain-containing protein n=1 Tax=Hyphobacterium sp. TaxID=2004662 RepID=UPI003BAD4197